MLIDFHRTIPIIPYLSKLFYQIYHKENLNGLQNLKIFIMHILDQILVSLSSLITN